MALIHLFNFTLKICFVRENLTRKRTLTGEGDVGFKAGRNLYRAMPALTRCLVTRSDLKDERGVMRT